MKKAVHQDQLVDECPDDFTPDHHDDWHDDEDEEDAARNTKHLQQSVILQDAGGIRHAREGLSLKLNKLRDLQDRMRSKFPTILERPQPPQ